MACAGVPRLDGYGFGESPLARRRANLPA